MKCLALLSSPIFRLPDPLSEFTLDPFRFKFTTTENDFRSSRSVRSEFSRPRRLVTKFRIEKRKVSKGGWRDFYNILASLSLKGAFIIVSTFITFKFNGLKGFKIHTLLAPKFE